MTDHHTKKKGDIAVTKAIADLTAKGYVVFTPVVCEHLPFDLIAWKEETFLKIQVKYSSFGQVARHTCWSDKNGIHKRYYQEGDFDYYAIYLPDKDKVIYPYFLYKGITIRTKLPNSPTPFYWWQDFLELKLEVQKRRLKDFPEGVRTGKIKRSSSPRPNSRKVERPSKEELHQLVWSQPTIHIAKYFGVSDQAVAKWCKAYGIDKPPRGYWAKLNRNNTGL